MVTVLPMTTTDPLQTMGLCAGICWNSPTDDNNKNLKRGLDCLVSGHGRVAEYPQIYLCLEGYSARVIRELYTHIGGAPTRLQASTRYINYGQFDYMIPPSIAKDEQTKEIYQEIMEDISLAYVKLEALGAPKEDIANILPLGMTSKVVIRTNLRQLLDMSHQRMCTRAYWEFRQLMNDIYKALCEYNSEWTLALQDYYKPKCEISGFCEEKNSCGRKPRKEKNDDK